MRHKNRVVCTHGHTNENGTPCVHCVQAAAEKAATDRIIAWFRTAKPAAILPKTPVGDFDKLAFALERGEHLR